MGTKYSTNATSGFNSLPPSDDGTVSEANKVKWATIKTKLADPIKTLADTINSELVTHFNNGPSAVTANTTLGASHYNQVIQASGAAVTLTLSDAATLLAGWYCWVRNTDTTESITIGRATAGDTFNGTAANYSLKPNEAVMIVCNAAANGFITTSLALADNLTFGGTNTHSGARLNIENAAPWIDFRETDQTLPAGKVRIYANANTWKIEKNTATAGDYSTSISSLVVNTDGTVSAFGGWSTGDVKLTFKTTADTSWVLMNDGTIGNAASGGTTRANADTEALFTLLWNNILDAWAPVSTGRGASAAADFAANKTITLPRALGRALAVSGTGATLTARALGEYLGAETHTLLTAEIPAHSHNENGSTAGGQGVAYQGTGGGTPNLPLSATGDAGLVPLTTANAGGGGAHNNMEPTSFFNVMVKL